MPKHNPEIPVNRIPATSPDIRADMLKKIREIYPALFGEGNALNAKELQALVDDYSKPEAERYSFPWAGKTASKRFAFTSSKARLVPDKERSVDFDTTQNLIIEGENLEVLKLLQSSYFKKVKMIYIDPPYNTGHDFVYPDDYSESKQAYWEKNGVFHDGVRMDTNTESSGRYHSNWLSMMQSRLLLARNLLRDDGVIFVSIDDNEVHNLRKLMDEIFGEENFVANVVWQHSVQPKGYAGTFSIHHNFIMMFRRSEEFEISTLERTAEHNKSYSNPDDDPKGQWRTGDVRNAMFRPNLRYEVTTPSDKTIAPPENGWRWSRETMAQKIKSGEIIFSPDETRIIRKIYLATVEGRIPESIWFGKDVGTTRDASGEIKELFHGTNPFDTPKPTQLITQMLKVADVVEEDVVLDFFAGSGTTAHANMKLNEADGGKRKFILVQLPEATDEKSEAFKSGYKTISQITIERVKRAGAKIKVEKTEVDVGFKALRLSKSLFPQNLFEVDPEMPEDQKTKAWEEYLEKSKQAHLFDFKPEELLVEIALKDGFDLNYKTEPLKEFKKNKVLDVSDGEKTALVCLDEIIQDETIRALEVYKERRFICLERAVDSTRKWNLKRMFGDNLWVA